MAASELDALRAELAGYVARGDMGRASQVRAEIARREGKPVDAPGSVEAAAPARPRRPSAGARRS